MEFRLLVIFIVVEMKSRKINNFYHPQVGGGGIVRDPLVHKEVLDRIISGVEEFGFCNKGWIESPIKGAEGNKEFLACFHRIPISESQPEVETKAEAEAT